MEKGALVELGVYLQQDGNQIPLRGGIYRPTKGSFIRRVEEIGLLPWTKDLIIDAFMFRMCDEFVRKPEIDWETKRKAIFAMIYHSYGFMGTIDDDMIHNILMNNPYDEDDNGSMVKFWQLGILPSDVPPPIPVD